MNNRQVNFNHLFYFHVIAQKKSLNSAAQYLNITVSTLSEHLRSFEDRMGLQLFDREGRKLVINDQGRRVFLHTSKMFDISEKLFRELDGSTEDITYLNIGITPSLSKLHTVQILEPLFQSEDFKVRITEGSFSSLVKSLVGMEISLLLCTEKLPSKLGRGLVCETIETAPYVFVGGEKYKDLKSGFPKSMEDAPFFNYTMESELRWKIDQFFKDNEFTMEKFGEVDDVSVQRAATRSNMCISLLPKDLVVEHVKNGYLHILGEDHELAANITGIYHGMINDHLIRKALDQILPVK